MRLADKPPAPTPGARPEPPEIGLATARELLDFSGGRHDGQQAWEEQLHGAVALHNLLVRERVAYLADEVGMGKTYVALGVAALFQHFQPDWRVLYIAPRENIQLKWHKELLNFTRNNWRVTDNRVRTYQGTPAYGVAVCGSLLALAHEAAVNPNRDFLLRLTSFSFGLMGDAGQWKRKRQALLDELPLLDTSAFDLRDKAAFKDSYARAINAVLPYFDLVIFDEGHNLKRGLVKGSAARNRLLSLVLGHPAGRHRDFPHYGPRFGRVLLLSATPLESDYEDLWHQLNVFGLGQAWDMLRARDDVELTEADKQAAAEKFLIRRLTTLTIGGQPHTKNMYRREWRRGGVSEHDLPLGVPDDRQRLIVALVQKKVAEVLQDTRFNHAFQIGMLASFESFLETARVKTGENEGVFDDADQAEDTLEKEGIDTSSLNNLARSYRRTFGHPMPHPKMDALAEHLKHNFATGRKALVFVRRVRSVDELAEKLNHHYDEWLRDRLLRLLPPETEAALARAFELHREERDRRRRRALPAAEAQAIESDSTSTDGFEPIAEKVDQGGVENFFTWWFRGERAPKDLFSGAAFKRNRLDGEGSPYSLFFEDNYVLRLLGPAPDLVQALADQTAASHEATARELRRLAWGFWTSKQKEFRRRPVYYAYQKAALTWLAERALDHDVGHRAQITCQERFDPVALPPTGIPENFPEPDDRLDAATFFTELAKRPALRQALWPEETHADFRQAFRRQEQRRELLASVATLGQPLIDLWALAVHRVGSLQAGQEDASEQPVAGLIADYLDLLEKQQSNGEYGAYSELAEVARHFDLILAVNFPAVSGLPLGALTRHFGSSLGEQNPVGGMSGQVNRTRLTQFRMPGYPLILITTDLLQEGEDLHTFCDSVYHYGIAWTPSSLEQRTGRIDRLHSLVHRRLDNQPMAQPDQRLQVFYPHLRETVEVLQVERVYERMNRFIRMLHRSLISEALPDSRIDTRHEFVLPPRDIQPISEPLQTLFPVREAWLHPEWPAQRTAAAQEAQAILQHFQAVARELEQRLRLRLEPPRDAWSVAGTAYLQADGRLVLPDEDPVQARQQPFRLALWLFSEAGQVLVRCSSPIGDVDKDDAETFDRLLEVQQELGFAKLCAVPDDRQNALHLSAEADLLFHPETTQTGEVLNLLATTLRAADHLEQILTGGDAPIDRFRQGWLGEGGDRE